MAFCTLAFQCQWFHLKVARNLGDESFLGTLLYAELPSNSEKRVLIYKNVTLSQTYEIAAHINTTLQKASLTALRNEKSNVLLPIRQWLWKS